MSIRLMSKIWDSAKVEKERLLVLLALADWANDDGECWPSMAAIAAKSRVTERGAKGIVAWLEQEGYLKVTRRSGRGKHNIYKIYAAPVKGEAGAIKGERDAPFTKPKKVNTDSPISEAEKVNETAIKGEADDIEKVKLTAIKGERENAYIYRNARVNHQEPSIEPSMNRQCTHARENSPKSYFEKPIEKFTELAEEVFETVDPKFRKRYQIGSYFPNTKIEFEKIIGTLAYEGYSADDVRKFRTVWPEYIKTISGKDHYSRPTRKQFFELFDTVLAWSPSTGKRTMTEDEQLAYMAELRRTEAGVS